MHTNDVQFLYYLVKMKNKKKHLETVYMLSLQGKKECQKDRFSLQSWTTSKYKVHCIVFFHCLSSLPKCQIFHFLSKLIGVFLDYRFLFLMFMQTSSYWVMNGTYSVSVQKKQKLVSLISKNTFLSHYNLQFPSIPVLTSSRLIGISWF